MPLYQDNGDVNIAQSGNLTMVNALDISGPSVVSFVSSSPDGIPTYYTAINALSCSDFPASGTSSYVLATSSVTGSSQQVAHFDHSHEVLTSSPVSIGVTSSSGSSSYLSRADHIHAQKPGTPLQTMVWELSSDVTVTSSEWIEILSGTINVLSGAQLVFNFAGCFYSSKNATLYARILLDDVMLKATSVDSTAGGGERVSMSIVTKKLNVTTGSRTVKVQLKVSSGVASCSPSSLQNEYSCAIMVQEIA